MEARANDQATQFGEILELFNARETQAETRMKSLEAARQQMAQASPQHSRNFTSEGALAQVAQNHAVLQASIATVVSNINNVRKDMVVAREKRRRPTRRG